MDQKSPYQHQTSFPEISYPSLRDTPLQIGKHWLDGKVLDDGAEGLWRVHDKLYDFTSFIKRHPGGEFWLRTTKGTDITEAFESHHITTIPESLLSKFFIRNAVTKRHSPFTFETDGFYRTLKGRIREELSRIPKGVEWKSKRIIEALAMGMFACSILSCRSEHFITKILWCTVAALLMCWTSVAAHNFLHQRDNWRMYFYNFSFTPSREMRITHALSHHQYPNTLLDYEITSFEPFFRWLPRESKSLFDRYAPRLYALPLYLFIFDNQIVKLFLNPIYDSSHWEDFVPLTLPMAMYSIGRSDFFEVIKMWAIIWHLASFFFYMIALNAAHHHPDIFHDGDTPSKDKDWGLHQLHAVMDRVEINNSYFAVLTHFGEHGLHHLFPTLDHAVLPYLHKVFGDTCREFATELRMTTQFELVIGQFQQISRTQRKTKT